ncbi:MAG: fibronectin type domain protein [Thermoleophilia bacterium]|nr:fibronectin type domain protein [Thermoleophilia bacterium]
MSALIDDLRALGYKDEYSLDSPERYVVYYDGRIGPGAYGYGGQAGISSGGGGGEKNARSSNFGGFFAVNYAHAIGRPDWPIILHEVLHNMSAVDDEAPQSSGQGHCTVDADIMCYTDEAGLPTAQQCEYTELDCGSDTYFHAGTPAPGSYLDTHWNVAAPYNRFLFHGTLERDNTRPSLAGAPTATTRHVDGITISWAPSTDDYGPPMYRVHWLDSSSFPPVQRLLGTAPTPTFRVMGMAPDELRTLSIESFDAAGNTAGRGASVALRSAADVTPPSSPTAIAASEVDSGSARLTWEAASDDVGVTGYVIQHLQGGVWVDRFASTAVSRRMDGLDPDTEHLFRIVARDAAGNRSLPSAPSTLRTLVYVNGTAPPGGGTFPPPSGTQPILPPVTFDPGSTVVRDTRAPSRPSVLRHGTVTRTSVAVSWSRCVDPGGGTVAYRVWRKVGAQWKLLGVVKQPKSGRPAFVFRGLSRNARHVIGIQSVDASGNASVRTSWVVRTRAK